MSKLEELIEKFCPDLPAGRQVVLSEIEKLPEDETMWYTYVLLCDNGSFYKGFTNNLKKRYELHLSGYGSIHTKKFKPLCVIYFEAFDNEQDAISREKYFKSGSGREWLNLKFKRGADE